jgi:hypothetical protein
MTADDWNRQNEVGCGVLVKLDDGRLWHTRTRSKAWTLGGGHPVIALEGRSGGYDLNRVTPMERQDTVLA